MAIPVVRINTEDFPFAGNIDYRVSQSDRRLHLPAGCDRDFRSIWYRRVRVPAKPDDMDAGIYDFCVRENRSALLGGLLGFTGRWMSRPEAIWKAEFKPYQLEIASRLGFLIPETIISNVPDSIRAFYRSCGKGMIAKPVRSGFMVQKGVDCAVFTTEIRDADLADLRDAALCPTIFQELIPKSCDIRITVVGGQIFAAAIESQGDPDATIDWRRTSNPRLPHREIKLPGAVEKNVLDLMGALSLNYGAIDMVLTPDDRYIFLEINPNGQWLWLDDILSLGISRAIANWLSEGAQ